MTTAGRISRNAAAVHTSANDGNIEHASGPNPELQDQSWQRGLNFDRPPSKRRISNLSERSSAGNDVDGNPMLPA